MQGNTTRIIIALLVAVFAAGNALAADPTQVLILGSFHMDNPGRDIHNMRIDDVLADKRQRELADIEAHLLAFRPTAVMVESQRRDAGSATLPRYREYLAGSLAPSRSEVVQVGFRLAKAAGLKEVYGIDVDGDFPYEAVQKYADAHGKAAVLAQEGERVERTLNEASKVLADSTLGATLRWFNRPEQIDADNGFYQRLLLMGGGDDQPGAAVVAAWGKRNLEICARLVQQARPGDRIAVVYGAGHAFLLRQCVRQMPGFQLVEANGYLP